MMVTPLPLVNLATMSMSHKMVNPNERRTSIFGESTGKPAPKGYT